MKLLFILHVYEMKVLRNYYYNSRTSIMLMFEQVFSIAWIGSVIESLAYFSLRFFQ